MLLVQVSIAKEGPGKGCFTGPIERAKFEWYPGSINHNDVSSSFLTWFKPFDSGRRAGNSVRTSEEHTALFLPRIQPTSKATKGLRGMHGYDKLAGAAF